MNWFAAIPATFSTRNTLNLTTVINPASPSHPSNTGNCAKLIQKPKSLYVLCWNEYEFGIAGRRPAKTFSKEGEKDGQVQLLQKEHLLKLGG